MITYSLYQGAIHWSIIVKHIKEAFAPRHTMPYGFRSIEANMIRWFIKVLLPVYLFLIPLAIIVSSNYNCYNMICAIIMGLAFMIGLMSSLGAEI